MSEERSAGHRLDFSLYRWYIKSGANQLRNLIPRRVLRRGEMDAIKLDTLNLVFGIVSLASFMFAVCTYYKKQGSIKALVEKLRASRNNFYMLDHEVIQIFKIVETNELSDVEKLKTIRQIAHLANDKMPLNTNTIDDGKEWGSLSNKQIRKLIFR